MDKASEIYLMLQPLLKLNQKYASRQEELALEKNSEKLLLARLKEYKISKNGEDLHNIEKHRQNI